MAVSAAEQIPGTDAAALIAGQLRLALAERLNLIPKDRWEFLWLTGFPLFEWSTSEKRWAPAQHPFTGIVEEDIDKLESAPQERALEGLRPGAERRRSLARAASGFTARSCRRACSDAGLSEEQRRAALRLFPRRADLRHAAAWRDRAGHRPRGDAAGGREVHSRSDRVPKTTAAQDLMAESPSAVDTGAAGRSGDRASSSAEGSGRGIGLGGAIRSFGH